MKIVTIIGARPQFIKAAVLSRHIAERGDITECIVHTGQHYDRNMSAVFFKQLGMAQPDYNLGLGGLSQGRMTGSMLIELEKILIQEKPDFTLVYGDTNSTIAGALAASKLHIKVIHVEAGLRSFNRRMPEEINRVMTDHASDYLFCPTAQAVENLKDEGITEKRGYFVQNSGDIMLDAFRYYSKSSAAFLRDFPVNPIRGAENELTNLISQGEFILATIHRDFNVDDPEKLADIIKGLEKTEHPVILPLHPRTQDRLKKFDITFKEGSSLFVTGPVSYFQMLYLEQKCLKIVTDSGGVQKEAYFARKPCIIIRPDTEWVELVSLGAGVLTEPGPSAIAGAINGFSCNPCIFDSPVFGNGNCAGVIMDALSAG